MTDETAYRSERAPSPTQARSIRPLGRTAAFVAEARKRQGESFVRSWLSASCRFEECVIWTSDLGRRRINAKCASEIFAHRIVIRSDAESEAYVMQGAQ